MRKLPEKKVDGDGDSDGYGNVKLVFLFRDRYLHLSVWHRQHPVQRVRRVPCAESGLKLSFAWYFETPIQIPKAGVPVGSLLGAPDPTKNQIVQDPETGESKAKMTEVKVDGAQIWSNMSEFLAPTGALVAMMWLREMHIYSWQLLLTKQTKDATIKRNIITPGIRDSYSFCCSSQYQIIRVNTLSTAIALQHL